MFLEMNHLLANSKKIAFFILSVVIISHTLPLLMFVIGKMNLYSMQVTFMIMSLLCGGLTVWLFKGNIRNLPSWVLSFCSTYIFLVLLLNNYLALSLVFTLIDTWHLSFIYKYSEHLYYGDTGRLCFVLMSFIFLEIALAFVSSYYLKNCNIKKSTRHIAIYIGVAVTCYLLGFGYQELSMRVWKDPYNIRYISRLDTYVRWNITNSGLEVSVSMESDFKNPCVISVSDYEEPILFCMLDKGKIAVKKTLYKIENAGDYDVYDLSDTKTAKCSDNMIIVGRYNFPCYSSESGYEALRNHDVWLPYEVPFPYEYASFFKSFYWFNSITIVTRLLK